MRRAPLLVLATVLVLAACGGGSSPATTSGSASASSTASSATTTSASSSGQTLSVRPPSPTPTSRVTFSFPAPATAGHNGSALLSFILTLDGPRHAGCLGPRTARITHVVKGMTANVQLGGTWCVGTYVARVQEFARPFCKQGQMCPQYVRLIGTVATARFHVAAP